MSTISSLGIGSGLDANSIVSQLVAIEKKSLVGLQVQATTFKTQQSLYTTIKSQVSVLGDAAAVLADASKWAVQKAVSSNPAAVAVTLSGSAVASSFNIEVTQLARAQSVASRGVAEGAGLGVAGETGSLTFELGDWSSGSFAGSGNTVTVSGIQGDDSLSTIAGKINAANAGVTATVLRSGGEERLVFRSSQTGVAAGFQVTSEGFAGLEDLTFTSMAPPVAPAQGMTIGQTALDAVFKIDGVELRSATNTLEEVVPGTSLRLNQTTVGGAEINIQQDKDAIQKNIQTFVDAYNALAKTLADATKYVKDGKSGAFQGDSTTIGLQNLLRRTLTSVSSGSSFTMLSEVGLDVKVNGQIELKQDKLAAAMNNMENLQTLFTRNNFNATTNGFGVKFKDLTFGLLSFSGTIANKSNALQASIDRNASEQDRVNERAARVEAQLRKQYAALDSKMASMSSLNAYVTAQLAMWNKPSK